MRDDLPVNRQFADVAQDEPEIHAEPGFEGELHAFSLFKYLSRSDVTWNPSVTSVCKQSLFCPTTEEFMLPVFHGNDRVEWFLQLSDEIIWDVADKDSGEPRARITMNAGDIAAMPADIRHKGYSHEALDAAGLGERDARAAASDTKAANCRRIRSSSNSLAPSLRASSRTAPGCCASRGKPCPRRLQRRTDMQTQLFIDGRFVPCASGETSTSLNPHDNSVIAEVAMAGAADVDRAVAAAKRAFPKWSSLAAADRGRLLLKLADAIEANAEELARLESLDTGHPIRDSRNLDVPRTAACFRYFGGMADKFEGAVIPVEAGLSELHDARAGRRRGAGRAVEFPADVHELEDGPGARGRQLRGDETGRDHAAQSTLRSPN